MGSTSWVSDLLPSAFELFKVDSDGNVQWNKTYGGEGEFYNAESYSGITTRDGGYLLAGDTDSSGYGWLVKTDSQGSVMWNRTYGELGSVITSVVQTQDGGYAFTGTGVFNWQDAWVMKTDADGNMDWNLTFVGGSFVGGSIEDFGACITQTSDGGFALVGTKDGKMWLVKLSSTTAPASILFPTEILVTVVAVIVVLVIAAIIVIKRRHQKGSQQQGLTENADLHPS
jgi:hypothetical protein